jgi:uncharacterized RDD family membrane protein YckC
MTDDVSGSVETHEGNPEIRYVGFWARFLAFFIDSTIVTLLMMPLMSASLTTTVDYSDPQALNMLLSELLGPQTMLITAVFTAIAIAFWIYFASTPGKMLFRGYIVDAKSHGKMSTRQVIIRYLGYYVSTVTFGLGFLWIGIDKRKQGLHDKMAGTVVINQKPDFLKN